MISSFVDLTIPFTKIAVGLIVLIGVNHTFQAIKEILISKFAISNNTDLIKTAFVNIKSAGKLIKPNHNELVLHKMLENINSSRTIDDMLLEDILLRLSEVETRLGVNLKNARN